MVRAGVVNHPSEWGASGYHEIQRSLERYSLIDPESLMELCGFNEPEQLKNGYLECVESIISNGGSERDSNWTGSIAVGNRLFVEDTKLKLGLNAKGRKVIESNDKFVLREPAVPYNVNFSPKKGLLRSENTYCWEISAINSIR